MNIIKNAKIDKHTTQYTFNTQINITNVSHPFITTCTFIKYTHYAQQLINYIKYSQPINNIMNNQLHMKICMKCTPQKTNYACGTIHGQHKSIPLLNPHHMTKAH